MKSFSNKSIPNKPLQLVFLIALILISLLTACSSVNNTSIPTIEESNTTTKTISSVTTSQTPEPKGTSAPTSTGGNSQIIQTTSTPTTSTVQHATIPDDIVKADYHPVITGSGLIVGGLVDGEWSSADDLREYIQGDEEYSFASLEKGFLGRGIGSRPASGVIHTLHGDYNPTVGVLCEWELIPRQVSIVEDGLDEYKEIVETYAHEKGEKIEEVKYIKVLNIDVQGDGNTETIISASSFRYIGEISGGSGHFSIILLKQKENGLSTLTPISEHYSYDFLDKIFAVADMDGDGELELLHNCEQRYGEEASESTVSILDWDSGEFSVTKAINQYAYLETGIYASLDEAKKFLPPYDKGKLLKEEHQTINGDDVALLTFAGSDNTGPTVYFLFSKNWGDGYAHKGMFPQAGFYKTSSETLIWNASAEYFSVNSYTIIGLYTRFSLHIDDSIPPPQFSVSFTKPEGSETDRIVFSTYFEHNVQKQRINHVIDRNGKEFELIDREIVYDKGKFVQPDNANDLIECYLQSINLRLWDETERMITNDSLIEIRKDGLLSLMWTLFHHKEENGLHFNIELFSDDGSKSIYRVKTTSETAQDHTPYLYFTVVMQDGVLKIDSIETKTAEP